jgi:hypothetical protein
LWPSGEAIATDLLLYEGRNGRFLLQITGHPDFGVPFRQDRLVPIFLATLAVQQKSQVICLSTATENAGELRYAFRRQGVPPLGCRFSSGSLERPRRFRAMLEQGLRTIGVIWPKCPARISAGGQAVSIDHGVAVGPKDPPRL